jgi:RNA polymerase sigma-70 factor (ECF subfamily)
MADTVVRNQMREDAAGVLAAEFSRLRPRLWRMVSFRLDPMLWGRVDPDDVLQEAWIAAAGRVDHFLERSSASLFVWLRLIVAQTLIDVERRHLGAQKRDAYRELAKGIAPPASSSAASLASRLSASLTSPSHAAMRDETARRLREAVDNMNEIDREVLALRHFEELTNSEVAEVLGIEQKAASIRYVRALRRLKTLLDGLPGFVEDVR